MRYINLTPHSVEVYTHNAFENLEQTNPTTWIADSVYSDQPIGVFPSEGSARITVTTEDLPHLEGGIPAVKSVYGEATGVPENVQPDDILIVSLPMKSMAVASGHPLAGQMVSPHKVVRSRANGALVLGCMGFTY